MTVDFGLVLTQRGGGAKEFPLWIYDIRYGIYANESLLKGLASRAELMIKFFQKRLDWLGPGWTGLDEVWTA
jgi:hypothetical protein